MAEPISTDRSAARAAIAAWGLTEAGSVPPRSVRENRANITTQTAGMVSSDSAWMAIVRLAEKAFMLISCASSPSHEPCWLNHAADKCELAGL